MEAQTSHALDSTLNGDGMPGGEAANIPCCAYTEATCLNEALLCPCMAPVMREEGEEAAKVIRRERQMKISIHGSGMHRKVFKISVSPKSQRGRS